MAKSIIDNGKAIGITLIYFATWYLGTPDKVLQLLLVLMVADYITGLLKAAHNKELNSRVGGRGFIKKIFILVLVGIAYQVDVTFGSTEVRTVVCIFYIANEGLSILENIGSTGVKIPEKLKGLFTQLNKEGDEDADDGHERTRSKHIYVKRDQGSGKR